MAATKKRLEEIEKEAQKLLKKYKKSKIEEILSGRREEQPLPKEELHEELVKGKIAFKKKIIGEFEALFKKVRNHKPVEKEEKEKKEEIVNKLAETKEQAIQAKDKIFTVFDRLLNLVYSKGEITLKEAAAELGAREADVETDAKILEEQELLDIVYAPIGGIKLRKKVIFNEVELNE